MEEILSYRLSDLLLFSEQTFYRQFALYNNWLSPFHYVAYLYAVLFFLTWSTKGVTMARVLAWITALLWLVCIYGYLYRLYAQINWMISYLIPLLGIQSILLVWLGYRASTVEPSCGALLLGVLGLLLPVFELLTGRSAEALPAYGLSPDSLSICSLALVFLLRQSSWYLVPALIWLVFSMLSYFSMESPLSWYLAIILAVVFIARAASGIKGNPTS